MNHNYLIKSLWASTNLSASDFTSLVVAHSAYTKSKIKGLISSSANKNYRIATQEDFVSVLTAVTESYGYTLIPGDVGTILFELKQEDADFHNIMKKLHSRI